jgi:hypothetical protein
VAAVCTVAVVEGAANGAVREATVCGEVEGVAVVAVSEGVTVGSYCGWLAAAFGVAAATDDAARPYRSPAGEAAAGEAPCMFGALVGDAPASGLVVPTGVIP